jgi:hypothetical protein
LVLGLLLESAARAVHDLWPSKCYCSKKVAAPRHQHISFGLPWEFLFTVTELPAHKLWACWIPKRLYNIYRTVEGQRFHVKISNSTLRAKRPESFYLSRWSHTFCLEVSGIITFVQLYTYWHLRN